MGSVSRRAKGFESVIGIVFLLHLVLVAAVLLVMQSRYDMARFGVSTAAPPKQEDPSQFGDIVPAGFEALSEPEAYDSETLYEKIDGKAPLYLESGFKELSTQRFVSTTDPNLWMEVYLYDMGDIRNAFSVYSVQKRAESEPFAAMQFAYKTSNAAYFAHGEYYIEIVGSAESSELLAGIKEAAQKVQVNLTIRDTEIAEFAMFPQENLIPDSFKLYTVSAFGCEELNNIFTAKYKIGEESVTAFLSKRDNPKEAEQIAESYRSFLIENGATVKSTDSKLFEGKVMDLFGTTEIVFTVGSFLTGVHESENQQAAKKLAEMLINKLNNE